MADVHRFPFLSRVSIGSHFVHAGPKLVAQLLARPERQVIDVTGVGKICEQDSIHVLRNNWPPTPQVIQLLFTRGE